MKKYIGVFVVLLLSIVFTGCSKDEVPSDQESSGSSKTKAELILGHAGPGVESNHHQQFSLKFKELVEERTNGDVTVKIHPNGELGGERDLIEGVKLGTVDISITANGPLGNFAKFPNALDFPFLFRDMDHVRAVLDGPIGEEGANELEEQGFKLLVWADNGFRYLTNNRNPISKPEDMKDLKMRSVENAIYTETYSVLGTNPVTMAHTELFTSLQQGMVEGMDGPITWLIPGKYHEVQKYMSVSNHFYSAAPILMSKANFEKFSPEVQQIILDSAEDAKNYQGDFIIEMAEKLINEAKEDGLEVLEQKDFDTEAFKKAVQPVYEKFEKEYGDLIKQISDVK